MKTKWQAAPTPPAMTMTELNRVRNVLNFGGNILLMMDNYGVGDLVCVEAVLRGLAEEYPKCKLTVIVNPAYHNGILKEVAKMMEPISFCHSINEIRPDNYDLFVDLHLDVPEMNPVDLVMAKLNLYPSSLKAKLSIPDHLPRWVEDRLRGLPRPIIALATTSTSKLRTIPVDEDFEKFITEIQSESGGTVITIDNGPVPKGAISGGEIPISCGIALLSEADYLITPDTCWLHIGQALGIRMGIVLYPDVERVRCKYYSNYVVTRGSFDEIKEDTKRLFGKSPAPAPAEKESVHHPLRAQYECRHFDVQENLMGMVEKVSIIIVNHNTQELLRNCIESIYATADFPYSITVSDNVSIDGSREMIRNEYPTVKLVENGDIGYGSAANRGILKSCGNYVYVSNPDVVFHKGWIKPLVDALKYQEVGIVGPMNYDVHGDVSSVGWNSGDWLDPDPPDLREEAHTDPEDVRMVCGAGFMFKRTLMQDIGMHDENFYLYYEETDLMMRSLIAGYRNMLIPESKITHLFNRAPSEKPRNCYFEQSRLYFRKKHVKLLTTGSPEKCRHDRPRLMAQIVVKDEADRYLPEVLAHLSRYVDGIVAMDNGSTDGTLELLEQCDKVVEIIHEKRDWKFNETDIRVTLWNVIKKYEPDWILSIDADEMFDDRIIDRIGSMMDDDHMWYGFQFYHFWASRKKYRVDGLWVPNEYGPRLIKYVPHYPYRWPQTQFAPGSVPENYHRTGPGCKSSIRMRHYGYARQSDIDKKWAYYSEQDRDGQFHPSAHIRSIGSKNPTLKEWDL